MDRLEIFKLPIGQHIDRDNRTLPQQAPVRLTHTETRARDSAVVAKKASAAELRIAAAEVANRDKARAAAAVILVKENILLAQVTSKEAEAARVALLSKEEKLQEALVKRAAGEVTKEVAKARKANKLRIHAKKIKAAEDMMGLED